MKNQKPSVFSRLGLPQDPKGEGNRLESTSEQLSKRPENGFLTPNMAKMTPSEGYNLTSGMGNRS